LYLVVPLGLIAAPIPGPCAEVECAGLKEKVEALEGSGGCVYVYIYMAYISIYGIYIYGIYIYGIYIWCVYIYMDYMVYIYIWYIYGSYINMHFYMVMVRNGH